MKKSKIFYVTAEVYPFVRGGRGAEFSGSLPPYVQAQGHEVRVLMPKYSIINERKHIIRDIIRLKDIPVNMPGGTVPVSIKSGFIPESKTQIYFADSEKYFKRSDMLRDKRTGQFFKDNDDRLLFLAKAAIETLKMLGWQPDVVHCCDWPTGVLPALIREEQQKGFLKKTVVTFSITDFHELGLFDKAFADRALGQAGLSDIDGCMHKNKFSFLKAGIKYADAVAIADVHKYLTELGKPNPEFEAIIKSVKGLAELPFAGDHGLWNPASNNTLHKTYTSEKLEKRQTTKESFLEDRRTGFAAEKAVLGILAEDLDNQHKAIASLLKSLKDVPLQIFILGDKNPSSYAGIKALVQRNTLHKVFHCQDNDDYLRPNFFAVSDVLWIPVSANYSELYYLNAVRYGCLPLVPKSAHVSSYFDPIKDRTGNALVYTDEKDMVRKIEWVLENHENKGHWESLVKRIMKTDVSIGKHLAPYIKWYERPLTK